MLFSKKIKSATCWQHLSQIISARHFLLKQFISDSSFKAAPLFEGSGKIHSFLEFHLLGTCINKSHLASWEMSDNLPHFLSVKGQHLFSGLAAWRCTITRACTYCRMPCWCNMNPSDGFCHPVCCGLPVLPGDIWLLNTALSGLYLLGLPWTQTFLG